MNKNVIIGFLSLSLLSACEIGQQSLSSVDDVYAVPSEARAVEKAAAEKARQQELAEAEAARRAAPKAIDPADDPKYKDPKYQDPQYSADDDYAYSSRLNRFHHPMGLGYYDAYYTNMYTYTGNPAFYGSSIYAGSLYNMGPGSFNNMSFGFGGGYGYGTNFGYMSPFYDPWMGGYGNPYAAWPYYGGGYPYSYGYGAYGYGGFGYSPYNSYWNGYNAGFNNGFNSGFNNGRWGYFNSFDANSSYSQLLNAPREVHGGGNRNPSEGRRGTEAPSNGQRSYLEEVAAQQQNRQRFNAVPNDRVINRSRSENSGTQRQSPAPSNNQNNLPQENNRRGSEGRNDGRVIPNREQQAEPQRRETPVIQPGGGDNSGRRGGDGGSSPRNTGGGGRPR